MKKIGMICVVTVAVLFTLIACEEEYEIGDAGPAGGTIFYDDEADGNDDIPDARYLEAAPVSTEWKEIAWGEKGIDIPGADKTAVGTGAKNTADIVNHHGADSDCPAALCDGLNVGGFDDWFMPSKDELDLMVENLYKNGFGDFEGYYYWSSSEESDVNVWGQHFYNGVQSSSPKGLQYRVRAVRVF